MENAIGTPSTRRSIKIISREARSILIPPFWGNLVVLMEWGQGLSGQQTVNIVNREDNPEASTDRQRNLNIKHAEMQGGQLLDHIICGQNRAMVHKEAANQNDGKPNCGLYYLSGQRRQLDQQIVQSKVPVVVERQAAGQQHPQIRSTRISSSPHMKAWPTT